MSDRRRITTTRTGASSAYTVAVRRLRGAYAVEFALVFLVFFGVFYAVLTWGLIFTAQQTLTLAAEDGARAALRFQSAAGSGARTGEACRVAHDRARWLHAVHTSGVTCTATLANDTACVSSTPCVVEVVVRYAYGMAPLVPQLMSWPMPDGSRRGLLTPTSLVGRASVRLDASMLSGSAPAWLAAGGA